MLRLRKLQLTSGKSQVTREEKRDQHTNRCNERRLKLHGRRVSVLTANIVGVLLTADYGPEFLDQFLGDLGGRAFEEFGFLCLLRDV